LFERFFGLGIAKFSLYLIKHYTTNIHEAVEIEAVNSQPSCRDHFTSKDTVPIIYWRGSWVGPIQYGCFEEEYH
jgi:hypothetical protein